MTSRFIDSRAWPCPTCDDVRVFVQPPCADCGSAFVIGDAAVVADVLRMHLAA